MNGRPQIGRTVGAKAFGHDADHGKRCSAQVNAAADYGRIAVKETLPGVIAEHDEIGAAGVILGRGPGAAEQGLYAQHRKEICAHWLLLDIGGAAVRKRG